MNWLRRLVDRIKGWIRKKPVNPVANVLAAGLVPPVETWQERANDRLEINKPNRKQRRTLSALERARRKHDKFVQPKGERPEPKVRLPNRPREAKPAAPMAEPIED